MRKITKIILLILIASCLQVAVVLIMNCNGSQVKTSFDNCLEVGKSEGFFSTEPPKDSVFIDKCYPLLREKWVDKYLYVPILDREKNVVGYQQVLKENESKYTGSEILLYLESGHFQRR